MFLDTLKRIFGTRQDRDLKLLQPLVKKINDLEPLYQAMSEVELQNQTQKFRQRLAKGETVDDLLPEAFATVREASKRVLKMRHFDVQLMGGMVLHGGKIAEMKTGEGKTLTATLPLYLNALSGKGAHLVTVNDYLAQRDAREMGVLFNWLGLTVGCIVNDMDDDQRQLAYNSDITYGTNNEFAFDYLRDNMKFNLKDYVQREHNFCIVDEVDSILIDEARTPLLISGPSEGNVELYAVVNKVIPKLKKEVHYTVDEKARTAVMTDEGIVEVQKQLNVTNLFDVQNIELLHHLNQALKAHTLFALDVDYVVKEGRVIIVDEFTGRLKDGSRWSDGLHQAVEAKEEVEVKTENQTLASITFQNYFRLYAKLAGMTGTADTEADEFEKIYNLAVVVVPTNVPMIRDDRADVIYKSKEGKYQSVGQLIKEVHEKGQPVLVGTISIESSERLSAVLNKLNVPHEVLNAKQHVREAEIVAKAGTKGSVTIATNMAGRGTDIKLTPETRAAGGLFILGTERHESRRIDNQLRGRSGRQGDPGASKFFLSLEDDLMRIFGSDRIKNIMGKLGMKEDEPIEHKMITNAIAKAQKKVESHNFDIRKHLLDFDNVTHEQRKVIYKIRREILGDEGNWELMLEMLTDVCAQLAETYRPVGSKTPIDQLPWEEIQKSFTSIFQNNEESLSAQECASKYDGDLFKYFYEKSKALLEKKFEGHDEERVKGVMREILLSNFDSHWKDHLLNMDHLKEGINLRSYGQKDPLTEYKKEAFGLYETMKGNIRQSAINQVFNVHIYSMAELEEIKRKHQEFLEAQLASHRQQQEMKARAEDQKALRAGPSKGAPLRRVNPKINRNDPCHCGSGKKFKHCHGDGQA